MFWKKNKPRESPRKIPFKGPDAFLEYCNDLFDPHISKGEARPAIVVDSVKEFGTARSVSVDSEGHQICQLMVASKTGAFLVNSSTAKPMGDQLDANDLVVWMPFEIGNTGFGELAGDDRSEWVGFIVAKIAPEIDIETGKFTILCRYQ